MRPTPKIAILIVGLVGIGTVVTAWLATLLLRTLAKITRRVMHGRTTPVTTPPHLD